MHLALPDNGNLSDLDDLVASTDADAAFRFEGVPPGPYRLRVWSLGDGPSGRAQAGALGLLVYRTSLTGAPPSADPLPPTSWAEQRSDVGDAPIGGLDVPLEPGTIVKGRVIAPAGNGDLCRMSVVCIPTGGPLTESVPMTTTDESGQFETVGLPTGTRSLDVLAGRALRVGSVEQGAAVVDSLVRVDVSRTEPLTVRLTATSTDLSGTVRTAGGRAAAFVHVLVYPQTGNAAARDRSRHLVTDQQGRFSAQLRSGRYWIVAIDANLSAAWTESDYLRRLVGLSTAMDLKAGDHAVVQLVAVHGP